MKKSIILLPILITALNFSNCEKTPAYTTINDNICDNLKSENTEHSLLQDISEPYEGDYYREALASVKSCIVAADELLFYYGENNCLIYRYIE
jgi:hypothetical protein